MKILREKIFTSRRTKELRNKLLERDLLNKEAHLPHEITQMKVTTIPGQGTGYSFSGNGTFGGGHLDAKSTNKLGIDKGVIGQSREITKEELQKINKKSLLDAEKRARRQQNKHFLSDIPDKLEQKERNKLQTITRDRKTGEYLGRSEYVPGTNIKELISKDNKKYKDITVSSAFDEERQDALRKFKQDKADKQAKLLAEKSKASVEKHKKQAEEIRNNNKLGVYARDAKRWVKKNPGKSAAIGLGAAVIAGGTAYAYKHYKDKKKDSDKKDKD